MRRHSQAKTNSLWPGPHSRGRLKTIIIRKAGLCFMREFVMSGGWIGRCTQPLPMCHLAGVVRCLCAGNYRNKPDEIRFEGFSS